MPLEERRRRAVLTICLLATLLAAACVLFLTIDAMGAWSFVLSYRGKKLAAMLVVAAAISAATVAFQTIAFNRILTPSIIGLDALFVLIQTALIFVFGAAAITRLDARLVFAVDVLALLAFSALIARWLFAGPVRDLNLLLLVGLVLGVLFRSLSGFMQRLMDPGEFDVLQERLFASFNVVAPDLLAVATLLTALAVAALWRLGPALDVLALGRDRAVSLGARYKQLAGAAFLLSVTLVAASTALVGPTTFFGLLAAHLAYMLSPLSGARWVMTIAALCGALMLVVGQTVLEHVLGYQGALGMVVELAGGALLLRLAMKRPIW